MSQLELDNLVRIVQLKAEPRNAQEVTRMPPLWLRCAGTATAAKTASPFFSAWHTPWAGPPTAGGC